MKFSKLQETKVQNYKTEKFTIVTELFDVRHQVISRNELQNASVIAHQQMTLYWSYRLRTADVIQLQAVH